jgi:putative hydrolase of HD superfamily
MTEPNAQRAISFMELLHAFQRVERVAHVPKKDRRENDVEHSYLLAMLAWYLVDSLKLSLDKNKVLRYALAHDLVEVYAGDTYAFTDDEKERNSKHQREHDAQLRIKKEFSEFADLHDVIEHYEERGDKESQFVYTVDKLIPMITNYVQDGRTWKEMDLPFDRAIGQKRERIGDEPYVRELLEQLITLIEKDRLKYFNE